MGLVNDVVDGINKSCIHLQIGEAEFYKGVTPSLEMTDIGATRALYSVQNGGVGLVIQDGKEVPFSTGDRKARIKYTTKDCTTGGSTLVDRCSFDASASADPFKYADIQFTGVYNWEFALDDNSFKTICENRQQFYDQILKNKVDSALKGYNNAILAQLVPLMGNYPNGVDSLVTPIEIPVITSNGASSPTGLALLNTLYRKMNQSGIPIKVGAGYLDYAQEAIRFSALASTGINNGDINLQNFFRDASVNDVSGITGVDNLLTWLPGAIKIVEHYANTADNEEFGAPIQVGGKEFREYEFSTVELGGLRWDYFMKRICDKWVFKFQKQFEVIGLPSDAFGACQDYNYALRFALGCGDLDCAAIETACFPEG